MAIVTEKPASRVVWRRRSLVLGLILVAWAGGFWAAKSARDRHPSRALVVDDKTLDFGNVWEDKYFEWSLPIENQSGEDAAIEGFDTSCNCLSISPESLVIPAGESRQVRVKLDLTMGNRGEVERDYTVSVSPRLPKGLPGPKAWTLRGRVRSALQLTPRQVSLGRTSVRAQPLPPKAVLVRALVPLAELKAETKSEFATLQVKRSSATPEQFEVLVGAQQGVGVGPLRFEVLLQPIARTGERLPVTVLTVEGLVSEDICTLPSEVLLGSRGVGSLVEETVTIMSQTKQSVEVTGIEVDAESGLSIKPSAENSLPSQKVFVLKQHIAAPKKQVTTCKFTVRTNGNRDETTTLRIHYYGVREE